MVIVEWHPSLNTDLLKLESVKFSIYWCRAYVHARGRSGAGIVSLLTLLMNSPNKTKTAIFRVVVRVPERLFLFSEYFSV